MARVYSAETEGAIFRLARVNADRFSSPVEYERDRVYLAVDALIDYGCDGTRLPLALEAIAEVMER